jgi:long-chain acyl-CoA synthetase
LSDVAQIPSSSEREPQAALACEDPHAKALTAPGGPYETRIEGSGEAALEVFVNHPRTLAELYRHAANPPERRALITHGQELSAGELFGQASALGAWLAECGVQKGDSVGIAFPTGLAWAVSFIAVTAMGARAAVINTRGAGEEMAHAVTSAGAGIVLAATDLLAQMQPHLQGTGVRLESETAIATAQDRFGGTPFAPTDLSPADGALILYTSGTTGRPKPVLHTHGSLAHLAVLAGLQADLQDLAYEREMGIPVPPDRRAASAAVVLATPLFHVGGITPFIRGMYFHAPLFFMQKWDAETAFALMERETVARLGFVPAMILDMVRSPRASDRNLGGITLLSNGAAALDPQIVAEIRAKMPRVMIANSYGQTESGGWGTSIYGNDYIDHIASAGYVVPTMQLRIADSAERSLPQGEHGEILLRGACVMTGYLGFPEATEETLRGGWLHTGDIGWVDEQGRLFIADRIKNMIISGGENVYAAEVERVLGEHPAVREVIAYGLPDERLGELVTATVVPEAGAAIDPQQLRSYARERLAGYKVPKQIFVRETPLPRTTTMKVDRGTFLREIKEQAQTG